MPRRPGFETVQYHQRILETDPIAYWIQDERVGTVSYDWVRRSQGSDQDGAYTGVTLGEPGIGDGRTSPYFDGVNDFNNVFTATLQGRFNGVEGTAMAWARVANSGVWTDGADRYIVNLRVNAGNNLFIRRNGANNNRIRWRYEAGGIARTVDLTGPNHTDWFFVALTWSASAGATGEVRAYYNGVQTGAIQVALGAWAGNLAAGNTVIGAYSTAPANVWHGYIAHCAVWNRALTPQELS